jgi:hypothetical protein
VNYWAFVDKVIIPQKSRKVNKKVIKSENILGGQGLGGAKKIGKLCFPNLSASWTRPQSLPLEPGEIYKALAHTSLIFL